MYFHPCCQEDCVEEFYDGDQLYRFSDGVVCAPYGCTNSIPSATNPFASKPTPDDYCATSEDENGNVNARCVPSVFRQNPGIFPYRQNS